MAITANVTNGKLDKTNTTPTQNRKTSSARQPQLLKLLQNSRLIIIKISHLSLLIHTE